MGDSSAPTAADSADQLREGGDLVFPDWSGAGPSQGHMSWEDMLRLSQNYLPYVTRRPGFQEMRLRRKVTVEFVL